MNRFDPAGLAATLTDLLTGDPWYGPSLMTALAEITPAAASARPLGPGSHSIWEIAGHIDAWNQVCLRRLAGEMVDAPPANFPGPEAAVTARAWGEAQRRLEKSCRDVIAFVSRSSAADFARAVPGKSYTVDFLLEGVGQHWIYHAGQIAMLRSAIDPKAE